MEEERLCKGGAQAGETPHRIVESALLVDDPGCDGGDAVIGGRSLDELADGSFRNVGVRVQEEHERRLAVSEPDVACVAEAAVLSQGDRAQRQVVDARQSSIRRSAVDDHDVEVFDRRQLANRLGQMVSTVVGDDHDVDHVPTHGHDRIRPAAES